MTADNAPADDAASGNAASGPASDSVEPGRVAPAGSASGAASDSVPSGRAASGDAASDGATSSTAASEGARSDSDPTDSDSLELTPPPPPETGGSKWMPLGVAAVAAGLLAVAVVVWQPWDRYGSTCWESDSNLIDDEARLCYTIPEGWDRMSDSELEESVASSGFDVPSSGVLYSEDGVFAQVEVHSLDAYFGDGEIEGDYDPDEELQIKAELVTVRSQAMFEGHDSVESDALTIDGFDAATASADAPDPFGTDMLADSPDVSMWVRTTIVDLGDEQSVLYSMALVSAADLRGESGAIAELNEVHDSIEVLDS